MPTFTPTQTAWINLVRTAQRLQRYNPTGDAYVLACEAIRRDLELLCPDAFRAVVAPHR